MSRPILLMMDDNEGELREGPFRPSRHSWTPSTGPSLSPVLSTQRQQLFVEEDVDQHFENSSEYLYTSRHSDSITLAAPFQRSPQHYGRPSSDYSDVGCSRSPTETRTRRRAHCVQSVFRSPYREPPSTPVSGPEHSPREVFAIFCAAGHSGWQPYCPGAASSFVGVAAQQQPQPTAQQIVKKNNFQNSATRRESEDDSFRRQISSSLDSNYPPPIEPSQKSPQGPLMKPQSVTTLRPSAQRMNSLQDTFENGDERKFVKTRPSTTSNSPMASPRKGSAPSNQKVARRPRSTDSVKMPQTGGAKGGSGGGGGGGGAGGRNGMPSVQRPSLVSTSKLPGISANSQSIILFCMDNARSDIAIRIVQRMAHKRDDFAQFYANLSNEQSAEFAVALKKFLSDIVKNIGNPEKIREISSQFGIEQAHRRSWGFKADFFAVLADALTTECVFLDGAAHQPTETIEAWATLVELVFTHVRNGYYQQIRQLRRNLQNFSSQSDQSFDGDSTQQQQQSFQQRYNIPASPQSLSTTTSDSLSESSTPKFPQ